MIWILDRNCINTLLSHLKYFRYNVNEVKESTSNEEGSIDNKINKLVVQDRTILSLSHSGNLDIWKADYRLFYIFF